MAAGTRRILNQATSRRGSEPHQAVGLAGGDVHRGTERSAEFGGVVDEDVKQIADREKCSVRQVNRTITLAFLAPTLVQAVIDGQAATRC